VEKKKTRFCQAIVTDGVVVISPDHNLDAFQLLQLQWGIETFTLSHLSNHANIVQEGQTWNSLSSALSSTPSLLVSQSLNIRLSASMHAGLSA
jgi:hypothetical protein